MRKTWLAPKSDESEPVSISDLLLCWLTETWFEVSEMPSPQTASTAEAFSDGAWVLPCRMTECGGYCAKTRQRKRHAPTHTREQQHKTVRKRTKLRKRRVAVLPGRTASR